MRRHARAARLDLEVLEDRRLPAALLALTAGNELVALDGSHSDQAGPARPVVGLAAGETLLAIAARPRTGQVYGLGSTGRLYVVNPLTAAARAAVPAPLPTTLDGHAFGLAFDPADRLHILTDGDQNLRVDPDTGDLTVDDRLHYPADGLDPAIVAATATNQVPGATVTTLYALDAARDALVTLGSLNGNPSPPARGELFPVGPLGVDVGSAAGLAIDGQTGIAYAALARPGDANSELDLINLWTGQATRVGPIGGGGLVRSLIVSPASTTIVALAAGGRLVSFPSNAPETILSDQVITGLRPGETLRDLDFSPFNGVLYALSARAGGPGRLYALDPTTAIAAPIGAGLDVAPPAAIGPDLAIDVDPTTGLIRVVSANGANFRIDPATGQIVDADPATPGVQLDPPLAYAPTDLSATLPPRVVGIAYDGATLYDLDALRATLDLQGSPGGVPLSVSSGVLTTIGPAGTTFTTAGFDVAAFGGRAYAALSPNSAGASALFTIDTATGRATAVGPIGTAGPILGLAAMPAGVLRFGSATTTTAANAGSVTLQVVRDIGAGGEVAVAYSTADGSARAGIDYVPTAGVLTFAPGERLKTITVPIRRGEAGATDRVFYLNLSSPAGGAVLGLPSTAVITLTPPVAAPTLAGVRLLGPPRAIHAVEVSLAGPIDPALLGTVAVQVRSHGRLVSLPIAGASLDPAGDRVTLALARPLPLARLRTLTIRLDHSAATLSIRQGRSVSYQDPDGDRVTLSLRRGGSLALLQAADGAAAQVWVIAPVPGRTALSATLRRRGQSDGHAVIHELIGVTGVDVSALLADARFTVGGLVEGQG